MTYTPSGSLIPTALSFYELSRTHHRCDGLLRGFPVVAREENVTGGRLPTQAAGALVPRLLVFVDLHPIALFAAATQRVHRRGPTQYRYTFVPTGTFLYIHSMSSSVMRMQPCDAEVPIDFWNGVPWIW